MRSLKSMALGPSLVGLVILGCSGQDPATDATNTTSQALGPACPATDYLYSLPSWIASCPAIIGWGSAPLFGSAPPSASTRYCRYTWGGAGLPTAADQASLASKLVIATNSSNAPEADCPVVAPVGFANSPAIRKPLYIALREQASATTSLPSAPRSVRVAVIDSAAKLFNSTQEDKLAHGRAVGRVIQDLGCGGGHCALDMYNELALPQLNDHVVDYTNGGFYGTRGQLAQAIQKAVDTWVYDLTKDPKNVAQRLVLNLSVGWVPEYGGTKPSGMPLPARAVYDALTHAACYGALVVAAAGNTSGEKSAGPMLPGGWETQPAPKKCSSKYKLPTSYALWPKSGAAASLVTAVSAVDELDRPLPSTRPGGQARLVAYGNNVVVPDTRSDGYTSILSGTSMATAVASAAAAAAWSYRPDLTFDQISSRVYEKAVALEPGGPTGSRSTDFCLGGTSCSSFPLRRVSVCDTAAEAAASAGLPAPKCQTVPAHAGSRVNWPADLTTITPMPSAPPSASCSIGSSLSASCGTEGDTSLYTPWVTPQPVPGCDVCTLRTSGMLYLDLTNPGYNYVRAITLVTYDAYYNPLSAQRVLSPYGDTAYPEVFRVPVSVSSGTAAAELRFSVTEGRSIYTVRESVRVY